MGRSAYADLAVVRVAELPAYAKPLGVADDDPDQGRTVAALGHPFGLEETITQGIVSGVNRSMPTDQGFAIPDVLQADAAINPGNSGGPLVTCEGRGVGANTAAAAEVNDLDETRGIVVVSVVDDGPASEVLEESDRVAGVDGTAVPIGGDVILAIDGQTVRTNEDLASYLLTQTQPGDTVDLTVLREGERGTVTVPVGERSEPGAT